MLPLDLHANILFIVYCKAMMPLALHAIDALIDLHVGGASKVSKLAILKNDVINNQDHDDTTNS
jgi:hypothetical protein